MSQLPPKPPTLTLQQRVLQVLSSNPRTRRVNCYTSGNTVTIFGKVFDNDAKLYAEKLVRSVPGVGNVIDSLTDGHRRLGGASGRDSLAAICRGIEHCHRQGNRS